MKRLNNEFDMGVVNDFFKYDYYDRGMMKWAGFYLSNHTTELKKEQTLSHNKDQQTIGKQQAEYKIGDGLFHSYVNKRTVSIQLKRVDINGRPVRRIVGIVVGYNETKVILNNDLFIDVSDIRNIEEE